MRCSARSRKTRRPGGRARIRSRTTARSGRRRNAQLGRNRAEQRSTTRTRSSQRPPRDVRHPLLGDGAPGHDRLLDDLWTGHLEIEIQVVTPLLLLDHAKVDIDADGHRTYGTTVDPDGRPDLPSTSVRGALRSAFESATNSRFGIGPSKEPVTRRMTTDEAQDAQPVRVTGGGGVYRIERLQALVIYEDDVRFRDHGERVWVVREDLRDEHGRQNRHVVGAARLVSEGQGMPGTVVKTGIPDAIDKRFERVFLDAPGKLTAEEIDGEKAARLVAEWRAVVRSYRANAQQPGAIEDRGTLVKTDGYDDIDAVIAEYGALLCYGFEDRGGRLRLTPAMIGRRSFDLPPEQALHPSVRAARDVSELSPADRVFGWVAAERGDGQSAAYAGQLRVNVVDAPPFVDRLSSPMLLSVLASPKVQQALFYAAGDTIGWKRTRTSGEPLSENSTLRGRKVYPFQANWEAQHARSQADRGGKQDITVTSWVAPGRTFRLRVDVRNLNDAELGALLWIANQGGGRGDEARRHLGLGHGKPLGFGATLLRLASARVRRGQTIRTALRALDNRPTAELTSEEVARLVETFCTATAEVVGAPADKSAQLPHLGSLAVAMTGFDDELPVHYPRLHEGSPSYEWFRANTNNVRARGNRPGQQAGHHALPDLLDDPGLPLNPYTERPPQHR